MNLALLRELIDAQEQRYGALPAGILRDRRAELERRLSYSHALAVVGLRRVGKSTLMRQIRDAHYADSSYYINFDDERFVDFDVSDWNRLVELCVERFGRRRVWFLDEVQNIRGWESFVRRMQDGGAKFFLTGSNAQLMSRELGTKLTGRYISFELLPFSFPEFLRFRGHDASGVPRDAAGRGTRKRHFNAYLQSGGMPEYLATGDDEILRHLYDDVLYRDVAVRYDVRDLAALRELALYYVSNVGTLVSFNKLKQALKLGSVNTVKSYTGYLENSFLVFTVNIFSASVKQQFIAPKKVYCIDTGLARIMGSRLSEDRGRFLENIVYLELRRRGADVFYYRTQTGREIDFAIRRGRRVGEVLQVAARLDAPETRRREIEALAECLREQKLAHGTILTEDHEETIFVGRKKIFIRPIHQWLLETAS